MTNSLERFDKKEKLAYMHKDIHIYTHTYI
jgi:hypothetical protein